MLYRAESDCFPAEAKAPLIGQLPIDGQEGWNTVNTRTCAEWKIRGDIKYCRLLRRPEPAKPKLGYGLGLSPSNGT